MESIEIPQQDIALKQTKQGKPITCFVAMHHGKLLSPCESFGDRKAQIEEAMHAGKALEVEKLEFSDQWKRWSVWFPRGSGGEAGYRSKFGGARPWQPSGYRGQPVPFDTWVKVSGEVLAHAVAGLKHAATELAVDLAPVTSADIILEQARSLVAQYWMAVERGITYPTGYEPRADAVAAPPQADAKTAGNGSPQPQPVAQDVYSEAIAVAQTEDEVRALMESIRKNVSNKVRQAELLTAALVKLRAVTPRDPDNL